MSNPFSKKLNKFSIIGPCYGDDWKNLKESARTLDEQEYKHFEWIVVFDGKNKDGEREMKKLKKKYPKMDISYYTIEHAGACAARNFGQIKATGDLYAFVNVDNYLYPEALRIWANEFENPSINRVWGTYDLEDEQGNKYGAVSGAPTYPNGDVWYEAFKYTNYCDSSFPIRKEAYIPWDETVKSLNDWDWVIRQLKRDNFQGKDFKFINHSFFLAEAPKKGGLSDDSHQNWIERTDYIRNKNGLPKSDICVTSLGAAHHGFHIAKKLEADYIPMPSFKPHKYKVVYLIGFYTAEHDNSQVTHSHMRVFENFKGTKIIHWIGTDVLQMHWNCSFQKIKALKKWFKENKIIHLTECEWTRKELRELGIDSKIIPIPPKKLYSPMDLPKEFSVAIYESSVSPMYNTVLMEDIVRAMPDVQFYFFGDDLRKGEKGTNYEHLGFIDMDEWMPKFSTNLRVSVHDGLPLLPIEFMTAGRQVIINYPLKGAIEVKKDRKQIVEAIRKAKKTPIDPKWGKYWTKQMDYDLFIKRIRGLK